MGKPGQENYFRRRRPTSARLPTGIAAFQFREPLIDFRPSKKSAKEMGNTSGDGNQN